MLTQSALSLEYVRVAVSAKASGSPINPTADVVVMAFTVADVDPVVGDWKSASWETDASSVPTTYYARCLCGPGGDYHPVAGTTMDCWVKVTDSPEIPARRVGNVQFT